MIWNLQVYFSKSLIIKADNCRCRQSAIRSLRYREYPLENSLIIGLALAVLLVLLVMRAKQGKKTPKRKSQSVGNTQGQPPGSNDSDWVDQVD